MRLAPVNRIFETIVSPKDLSSICKRWRTEYSKRSRNFGLGNVFLADLVAVRHCDHSAWVSLQFLQDGAKRRSRAWVLVFDEPSRKGCSGERRAPSFARSYRRDTIRKLIGIVGIVWNG